MLTQGLRKTKYGLCDVVDNGCKVSGSVELHGLKRTVIGVQHARYSRAERALGVTVLSHKYKGNYSCGHTQTYVDNIH